MGESRTRIGEFILKGRCYGRKCTITIASPKRRKEDEEKAGLEGKCLGYLVGTLDDRMGWKGIDGRSR